MRKRTRDRNLLRFSARKRHAVFIKLAQQAGGNPLRQFLYFFFKTESKESRIVHGFARGIVILAAELLTILILKGKTDALAILGAFYMANLLVSIVFAYMQGKKGLIFAIALTLLLCSGVFAGLSTAVSSYFQVAETSFLYKLANADFNFVWLFYLPAQALVSTHTALQSEQFKY